MSNIRILCRRALVTGATGYIGGNLVSRLVAEGWDVQIIVRPSSTTDLLRQVFPSVTVHEYDGSTRSVIHLVGQAKPDVVFHLASLFLAQHTSDDIEALIASNLLFSTQLAEALAVNKVNFLVNTGTSWQHHNNEDYSPVNLYAATKQAFEDILAYYVDACRLRVTTLRLFDTYGPKDPRQKLISLLWKATKAKEPILMSAGQQLIDLVHVDDVLAAFLSAAEQLPNQNAGYACYGVSSGKPFRLVDLVAAFEQATGHSLPITWGGRPYRPREVMTPWSNFQTLPGWFPRISFETGILTTRPIADAEG